MAQVTVTINQRAYRIGCEEGQEQTLAELAEDLDTRIERFRASFGEVGDMRLIIMAALEISDELGETRQRLATAETERSRLEQAQAEVAETLDHAAGRVEKLAASLNGESGA